MPYKHAMAVPSQFNLVVRLDECTQYLIFNTLSGSAALVPADIAEQLCSGFSQGPLSGDTLRVLETLGMLVESAEAESRKLDSMLHEYWHPRTLKLTLCHTAGCQMSCIYCFQSGRDLRLHHTPSHVAQTLLWAEEYLNAHADLDSVHLGLMGGEPLTDVEPAKQYVDRFLDLTGRRALNFTMSLTTNGINLDHQLIAGWTKQGLKYLRVTLDGPPDVHHRRRPCRSGEESFDTIVRNLCKIKELRGLGIGVSINVDDDNVDSIADLLYLLDMAGLSDDIEIVLEPTLPRLAERSQKTAHRSKLINTTFQAATLGRALDTVIAHNFRTPIFPGLCKPCNFVQSHNFVISWDGGLFRCTFTMLNPEMSVGTTAGGISSRNENLLESRRATDFCKELGCAYLPICAGGCRYQAWWQTGDWTGPNCPRSIWDRVLPGSIAHAFGLRPAALH